MSTDNKPTKEQIAEWKMKAEKWDSLKKEIDKFYCNKEGEYDEKNPEREGNFCDIGEMACIAFGWF